MTIKKSIYFNTGYNLTKVRMKKSNREAGYREGFCDKKGYEFFIRDTSGTIKYIFPSKKEGINWIDKRVESWKRATPSKIVNMKGILKELNKLEND